MKINIYYGGRGLLDDPTLYVISRIENVLKELRVKVERYNIYEHKNEIATLPQTFKDVDGIILATTVEWLGIGGYMQQFLDACWLYGDKEKISNTYMQPIVMSTTYGEREAETNTTTSMKKDTADSATTSHASEKKTVEQVGSNRISLSGKRLRLIAESNPNYVPFTYDNITLEIPANYLLSLNLKDDEVLIVSIVPGSGKEVTLAMRAAGKVLTNIPNSRLTWKQENKTRTIDKTGVYKPPGSAKQNLPVKRNRVPRLVILGAIVLVLISTGCFVYHKKERKH